MNFISSFLGSVKVSNCKFGISFVVFVGVIIVIFGNWIVNVDDEIFVEIDWGKLGLVVIGFFGEVFGVCMMWVFVLFFFLVVDVIIWMIVIGMRIKIYVIIVIVVVIGLDLWILNLRCDKFIY